MRVNEIFYSLQGEGCHSGTPAVFVRFSGCNLQCPFCDTRHQDGKEMSVEAIVGAIAQWPAKMVVMTGGEPLLQLTEELVHELHQRHYYVAVETNGTMPLVEGIDWVTLSPKDLWLGSAARPVLEWADELKVLYDGTCDPAQYDKIRTDNRLLQPMDTGDPVRNAAIREETVRYCLDHPQWSLSLQIHKILQIP